MVISYDNWKKSYESLDAAQKQQYIDAIKNKGADYVGNKYLQQYNSASASTSTPKNTSSNTVTETYRGQVSDGTANMNSMSQTSAKENSRNAQVGTGDVAGMPQQPSASLNVGQNQTSNNAVASRWNQMTAAEQLKALANNKDLGSYLSSKGLTTKQEPAQTQNQGTTGRAATTGTTGTTNRGTTYSTPKQDERDYQDNSQARMNQMANNLLGYEKSMPRLFDNWAEFYNFFIKDKGRSQDQIDFLEKYFDDYKKYSPYDSMSPSDVGAKLANGEIPDGYLDFVKGRDPNRYAEIIAYKKEGEDTIKYESYLSEASELAGLGGFLKWNSETFGLEDKNQDGLWDIIYHAPTEEELKLNNEDSEYEAEKLKLKNAMKWLQDDMTDQYPDADLSTIMLLTADRGDKIQRAIDTISVAQTKTQGRLNYLQNERATMDKAGNTQIANLQKNLGMYYSYSPEGISELAQAQYGATNITLDQADSGTETQKQMALQNVLDGYYAKYGDIIQRSEQQVINDVIAYAKKNGVGLAEALQKNFVEPLQAKPGFAQLNSVTGNNPDVFKIGENMYGYWDENGNLVPVSSAITPAGTGTMRTERNNNPTAMTTDVAKSLGGVEGVDYVQGDSFQTSDGRTLYTAKLLGDPVETTIKLLDRAATNGNGAFYTKGGAQRWSHTAMSDADWLKLTPEQKQSVVLNMLQREGGDINKMAYYNQQGTQGSGQLYNPDLTEIYKIWGDTAKDSSTDQERFWKQYGDEIAAAGVSKQDFLKQYDEWYEEVSADAYLDILAHLDQLIELTGEEYDMGERGASIFGAGDVGAAYDYIKNNLTVNGLRDAKAQGLKLGVLSDSDVRMIGNAATTLKWHQSQGSWNKELQAFREKLLGKNKYLRERYQNTSAYTPDTTISYNDTDRTYTITNNSNNSNGNGGKQTATRKAKKITDLSA